MTWPKGYPRPLLPDQADDDLIAAWNWASIERLELAVIYCHRCERERNNGTPVAEVIIGVRPTDDGHEMPASGPLIHGTRKAANADWRVGAARGTHRLVACGCADQPCEVPEHRLTGDDPATVPTVPKDDRWIALLNRLPMPSVPAWCPRHGSLLIDVRRLRSEIDLDRRKSVLTIGDRPT